MRSINLSHLVLCIAAVSILSGCGQSVPKTALPTMGTTYLFPRTFSWHMHKWTLVKGPYTTSLTNLKPRPLGQMHAIGMRADVFALRNTSSVKEIAVQIDQTKGVYILYTTAN